MSMWPVLEVGDLVKLNPECEHFGIDSLVAEVHSVVVVRSLLPLKLRHVEQQLTWAGRQSQREATLYRLSFPSAVLSLESEEMVEDMDESYIWSMATHRTANYTPPKMTSIVLASKRHSRPGSWSRGSRKGSRRSSLRSGASSPVSMLSLPEFVARDLATRNEDETRFHDFFHAQVYLSTFQLSAVRRIEDAPVAATDFDSESEMTPKSPVTERALELRSLKRQLKELEERRKVWRALDAQYLAETEDEFQHWARFISERSQNSTLELSPNGMCTFEQFCELITDMLQISQFDECALRHIFRLINSGELPPILPPPARVGMVDTQSDDGETVVTVDWDNLDAMFVSYDEVFDHWEVARFKQYLSTESLAPHRSDGGMVPGGLSIDELLVYLATLKLHAASVELRSEHEKDDRKVKAMFKESMAKVRVVLEESDDEKCDDRKAVHFPDTEWPSAMAPLSLEDSVIDEVSAAACGCALHVSDCDSAEEKRSDALVRVKLVEPMSHKKKRTDPRGVKAKAKAKRRRKKKRKTKSYAPTQAEIAALRKRIEELERSQLDARLHLGAVSEDTLLEMAKSPTVRRGVSGARRSARQMSEIHLGEILEAQGKVKALKSPKHSALRKYKSVF